MSDPEKARACRVCGCTNDNACVDKRGQSCHWVEWDLCNRCVAGNRNDKPHKVAA